MPCLLLTLLDSRLRYHRGALTRVDLARTVKCWTGDVLLLVVGNRRPQSCLSMVTDGDLMAFGYG